MSTTITTIYQQQRELSTKIVSTSLQLLQMTSKSRYNEIILSISSFSDILLSKDFTTHDMLMHINENSLHL